MFEAIARHADNVGAIFVARRFANTQIAILELAAQARGPFRFVSALNDKFVIVGFHGRRSRFCSTLETHRLYAEFGCDTMRRNPVNFPGSGRGRPEPSNLREVLFELSAVGNSVKVCAVDPVSLVEATIFGPVGAGEQALKHAALRKLRYVLAKRNGDTISGAGKAYG